MSDNEGHSGAPPSDEDLSLPKATVAKMISGTLASIMDYAHSFLTLFIYGCVFRIELLPKDVTCAKDTRDLVIECCVGEGPAPFPLARPPLMRALCSVLSLQ